MPEDEFDIDAALEQAKGAAEDFDVEGALAAAAEPAVGKLHPQAQAGTTPVEQPWYERLANRIYDDYSDPAAAYERAARGVESDPEWQARAEAVDQLGPQARDIQSSPGNVAGFAGRTAAGIAGQYAGGALGLAPVTSTAKVALPLAESTIARAPALLGPLARGVNVAAPAARVGLGAAGGGLSAGTDAFAHGDDVLPATGSGMLWGGGLTGAGEALAGMGRGAQGSANRKLAERSLSSPELADVRAEGGSAGVKQAGQELRDLGVTKSRGLLDFFRGNTPERMSENSLDILNRARAELDRASSAVTDAPARDVAQYTSEYAPDAVTVGQAPVDVSPVSRKLHSQADALDYAKNPDKAQTYRNLATELTTPAPVREPAPNASFEPVALESRVPETPDAPVSQLPIEPGLSPQVDPAAVPNVSEPFEFSEPPMSSQPMDDGNLLDLPAPTGPGEIDVTSHLRRPYETSQANVSGEPILDLEPTGPVRNPAMEAGAVDANMSEQPVDTYQGVATGAPGRALDLPPDTGENLLLTPPDHAISNPLGTEPVDQSYWPAPYEMSRNEPPMPAPELPLPPAAKTVLEHTPRFKGDSPGPGLELDQPRQDFQPDNLLAPTALYPDNPPLPSGEMAPPGMSRRAPIVGPVQRTPDSKLTGSQPPSSNLLSGAPEPVDVSGISPTTAPMDSGFFPETPRPMTPADPSTGFTLEQLMAMRRELGNQTRNFSGRPLNKVEGDMGAATRDAWKGSGDAITGALEGHVEAGNITPDIVNAYRDANKTFSTIADVNKNLASRTNQAYKAPIPLTGGETILGGGTKATAAVAQKMLGLNAQYGTGKVLEGVGSVGSDLARMGAGLGWNHSEMDKAQSENPQAPKAEVEQKANDDMKTQLQKTWYNVLSKATSMFQ